MVIHLMIKGNNNMTLSQKQIIKACNVDMETVKEHKHH